MSDNKKTLKFQMMMSPAEAEVLDNWMFENRIRSRAEAIRRLVQIGLTADKLADGIGVYVDAAWGYFQQQVKEKDGVIDVVPMPARKLISLCLLARDITVTAQALRGSGKIDEAMELAKKQKERVEKNLEHLMKFGADQKSEPD